MKLQAYTHEDLFSLAVSIVRSITGVEYPFTERTYHRALAQTQAMFAASANMETLRLIKGDTLEGLSGELLDRRVLQNNVKRYGAAAARVIGRFVRSGPTGTAVAIPPLTIVIRAATATQSEIAFRSEAAATIDASETQSNLIFCTCTETGEKGNAIPASAQLALKESVNSVAHFLTASGSAGGFARETDATLRVRGRDAQRASGECTWSGIETRLKTIELFTGQQLTSARLFEAFDETSPLYTGLAYAIIDDGSGTAALIGALDTATYGYGGSAWYEVESQGYDVYVQIPDYPFDPWQDGVNAVLQRDNGSGWTAQTYLNDYFVDDDRGVIALVSPLTTGQKIRIQFSFYTGLIKEAAKYINGIYKSETVKGWRPVGYSIRVRAPFALVTPTVSGSLVFYDGWDSQFGRAVATTNVLAYLNGLEIGEAARYDVIQGIVHKTPGIHYLDSLSLDGGTDDVPTTHKFGVVRGLAANISF